MNIFQKTVDFTFFESIYNKEIKYKNLNNTIMENLRQKIVKENVSTDITNFIFEFKDERNERAKTFHYVAKLTDYKSSTNINREFFNVGDMFYNSNKVSYTVSTSFLNKLKVGEILEIKINIKTSNRYSSVSKTYIVIKNNQEDYLEVEIYNTPLRAFKEYEKLSLTI